MCQMGWLPLAGAYSQVWLHVLWSRSGVHACIADTTDGGAESSAGAARLESIQAPLCRGGKLGAWVRSNTTSCLHRCALVLDGRTVCFHFANRTGFRGIQFGRFAAMLSETTFTQRFFKFFFQLQPFSIAFSKPLSESNVMLLPAFGPWR